MYEDDELLPYAVDAETPLRKEELQILQRQYEREGRRVGVQTKFNYAWGLVKSLNAREQEFGVELLEEIFTEYPERQRECLYYISLGHYKLGNYNEANRYNAALLEIEPENKQAISLKGLIEHKCAKDGYIGIAIASSAVAALGIIAAAFLKRK
ncbi:hypothetical protein BB559_004410 [Furculomyces boomerangus]|uniref:Mitochondrial fission 1 protein n=2 Tax=Harpellales TaxID=61421 RepID=A0A2T9YEV7_9FUNG|nr:hypothetical protein BB559_006606 [Furculomyces boomerangus]PVU90878.1 hypothetical protein BB559_004410 [Furculomyces boomerangus]PVZ96862.1 hypothetical protein BB558_007206 [Smittium angustum]PWA02148.1 hypothetical protein BB558_001718 [Smittium angustum]